jgi:hypothetical protein
MMNIKDKLKETVQAGVDIAKRRIDEYSQRSAEEKAVYQEAYKQGKIEGIKARARSEGFKAGRGDKGKKKDYAKGVEEMFSMGFLAEGKKGKKEEGFLWDGA